MNLKSTMVNQSSFAVAPQSRIPRSTFDRSKGHKTTIDADYLYPIYLDEVIPGDLHVVSTNTFARLATPLVPVMDNMYADVHYFFVPSRLLWVNFEKFHGEQKDPGDSTAYVIPKMDFTAPTDFEGELGDYFGLPCGVNFDSTNFVNVLPFRAYNLIYNDWYRDENLQASVVVNTDNGPDLPSDYNLLRRGKRKDYFTSCLPWPQKGTAPEIPIFGVGDIITNGVAPTFDSNGQVNRGLVIDGTTNHMILNGAAVGGGVPGAIFGNESGLEVDADAGGLYTLVNDIRTGFQVQKLLERDARGGTRYVEMLKSHYNVISPDFRLQRPEYLGGGTTRINITPVPQTSVTAATPQGNLAGYGTFAHNGVGFTKAFVEHGYILGLISIRADLSYQNGLDRMWSKQTRYDFYYPVLANLGEQVVYSRELDFNGVDATDNLVFGYQERYAEYRYNPAKITGKFRSQATGSIDIWHLAEEFVSPPTFNPSFIVSNTPVDRVIAVPSQPHFLLDCYFQVKSTRPMPVYSVPGYVDHF